MIMNKIKLPNVTLCTFGSEKYKNIHQKSLDYASRYIDFGAVKNIIVDTNNIDEWNKAVVFDLGDYIDTEFALLIHADGSIGEPQLWDDAWLKYDYIGSPWPLPKDNFSYRDRDGKIQRVGNSVSLRSKKLLTLPKKIGMEWRPFHGWYNEDGYICVNMRHVFEEHGCKFAPFEVALKFGKETPLPENKGLKTFLYHKTIGENARYPDFERENLLITELYHGQGMGNQLACYVATRSLALDLGFDFGIMHPEKFKGMNFMDIDFGKKVSGGKGPEGGPPKRLPVGIDYYYSEKKFVHPENGFDIRDYDTDLKEVYPNTKIDGIMQGEGYFKHHKNDIKNWLKIKEEYNCFDYSNENTCIINFRGGEYVRHSKLFLEKTYWDNAIKNMIDINPDMKFIVITDDVPEAKKFFPNYEVFHFNIGKDYSIIKNAYYLILSNSSFAWFPAWLNENVKLIIAPKYWAAHNVSDGYWSCSYNITEGFMYQDKLGTLFNHEQCRNELNVYKNSHKEYYDIKNAIDQRFRNWNPILFLKKKIGSMLPHRTRNLISKKLRIF